MNDQNKYALVGVSVGLLLLMMFGFVAMLSFESGSMMMPMILISVVVLLAVVGGVGFLAVRQQRQQPGKGKRKRGQEDVDMYALIDDLVEDLTPEEAIYLQQRLDEAEGRPVDTSLDSLLDESEPPRSRRRR